MTQVKQTLKRLLTEYVHSLNKRQKTTSREAALEENDVVWLPEEFTPRGIFPLGRVKRTFAGPDNIAMSSEVETALGKLTRTAVKPNHVYLKLAVRLGLGFVGPKDVNAKDKILKFIMLYSLFYKLICVSQVVTRKTMMMIKNC